jgi:hypothetical protein
VTEIRREKNPLRKEKGEKRDGWKAGVGCEIPV